MSFATHKTCWSEISIPGPYLPRGTGLLSGGNTTEVLVFPIDHRRKALRRVVRNLLDTSVSMFFYLFHYLYYKCPRMQLSQLNKARLSFVR